MKEIVKYLERIARGEDTCASDIEIPTGPIKNEYEISERYKTCGKCKYDGDGADIVGSKCYLCRRNPTDNRIDWFELVKE